MESLREYIEIKRKNAAAYKVLLSDIREVEFLWEKTWVKSNFWFYTIRVPKEHKKLLMEYLLSKGIQVRTIWKIINTLSMYKECQTSTTDNAMKSYETCINLPCSVTLKEKEIAFVVENIKSYFGRR